MTSSHTSKKCPHCNGKNTTKLIWGYPSPELIKNKNRKDFELRGCVIDSSSKAWKCNDCSYEWGDVVYD